MKRRLFGLFLTTILLISTTTTAFAAEEGTKVTSEILDMQEVDSKINEILNSTDVNFQEVEIEVMPEDLRELTEQEAIEAGFTEQEAENKNIYEITPRTEYNGSLPATMYSGDVGYEDVTASGSFTGTSHTLYGNKVKFAVRVHSGYGNFAVGLYSQNSNWPYSGYSYFLDQDGTSYQSGWYPINKGDTFNFRYFISTAGTNTSLPISFRIILATY